MTAYEVPIIPGSAQSFVVSLGSRQLRMTLRWCPPAACWVMDLDEDTAAVAHGLPLVPGADLLGQLRHLGFDGQLQVQSLDAPGKTPDFDSLGTNGLLFFVTP